MGIMGPNTVDDIPGDPRTYRLKGSTTLIN